MKTSIQALVLIACIATLAASCTLSEIGDKTKSGFKKTGSYISEKSKKAYGSTKKALGLDKNSTIDLPPMSVSKQTFGTMPDGKKAYLYSLANANGMKVKVSDYGGTVVSILAPDRDGKFGDVALGFKTLAEYQEKSPYFGCITGRYANRIADGNFTLEGKKYSLAVNNGKNHLHGGVRGFDKRLWDAEVDENDIAVTFTRTSPDGEEGYPGSLVCNVTYTPVSYTHLTLPTNREV